MKQHTPTNAAPLHLSSTKSCFQSQRPVSLSFSIYHYSEIALVATVATVRLRGLALCCILQNIAPEASGTTITSWQRSYSLFYRANNGKWPQGAQNAAALSAFCQSREPPKIKKSSAFQKNTGWWDTEDLCFSQQLSTEKKCRNWLLW